MQKEMVLSELILSKSNGGVIMGRSGWMNISRASLIGVQYGTSKDLIGFQQNTTIQPNPFTKESVIGTLFRVVSNPLIQTGLRYGLIPE
jgi:hypothetical protein